MQVNFDEIPVEGRRYTWQLSLIEDDVDCQLLSPLHIECFLQKESNGEAVRMQGSLVGQVGLTCDRCLAGYAEELESVFSLLARVIERHASKDLTELEAEGEDPDIVELSQPCVDLDEIIRQQVHLALPEKRICTESCQGICQQCGTDLNINRCVCAKDSTSSPFGVLAGLLDSQN